MSIHYKKAIIFTLLSIVFLIVSFDIGMFWDNVLFGAKMGNDLYHNGIFRWSAIALEHDAGHPPLLATLLAMSWTVFGKSLVVSHWVMFPFSIGLLWQLYNFVSFFIKDTPLRIAGFVLVLADPTLLSQFVLVAPEAIQLFFLFMALNGILRHQTYLKIIGLALLGIASYRGMMLCAGLFLVDAVIHLGIHKVGIRKFFEKKTLSIYLIAALPACSYLTWRLITKGWIISHPSQLWGSAWHFTSVQDFLMNFLRNIAVLGFQFTDFGRMTLVLFILYTLFIKRKSIEWKKYTPVIAIIIFSTIVIYGLSLLMKNTMGHRYYITSFLAIGLLAFMLSRLYRLKKGIYVVLLVSLLGGNFIVYSDAFAQGWGASLAHLPYWDLRKQAIEYMDTQAIPIGETSSFFPNSTTIDDIELNGDIRAFVRFTGTEPYVFYSNVYNLTDEELALLRQNYTLRQSFAKYQVRVEIFEHKNSIHHKKTIPH